MKIVCVAALMTVVTLINIPIAFGNETAVESLPRIVLNTKLVKSGVVLDEITTQHYLADGGDRKVLLKKLLEGSGITYKSESFDSNGYSFTLTPALLMDNEVAVTLKATEVATGSDVFADSPMAVMTIGADRAIILGFDLEHDLGGRIDIIIVPSLSQPKDLH